MSLAGVIGYEPRNSGRPALHRRGDEPQSGRAVAGDIAIKPRGDSRGRHLVRAGEHLGGLAVVVAGLQRFQVGIEQLRRLLEAAFQPAIVLSIGR